MIGAVIIVVAITLALGAMACLVLAFNQQRAIRLKLREDVYLEQTEAMYKAAEQERTGKGSLRLYAVGLPLNARAWLIFRLGVLVVVVLLALVLSRNIVISLVLGAAGFFACGIAVNLKASMRNKRIRDQLPQTLMQIAQTMSGTGRTFAQALRIVADSSPEPIASELQQVKAEVSQDPANAPEAIRRMGERIESSDLVQLREAVELGQTQGSNISPTLFIVAETVTEYANMRRRVASETSGAKLTMVFLALFVPGVCVFQCASNPQNADFLLNTPLGWGCLAIAAALEVVGIVWILKTISNIKV